MAQLDPLGILPADLSDSVPADLSLEYWSLGKSFSSSCRAYFHSFVCKTSCLKSYLYNYSCGLKAVLQAYVKK